MNEINPTTDTEADTTAPTTDTDPTTDPTTDTSEPAEPTDAELPKASREAAKYRRQLRDAEAERDALASQLEAMRRAEVDRLAEAAKVTPAALWAAGTDLANLLAEDGTVDPLRVAEALKATRELFGISPKLPPAPPAWGQGNVGSPIGAAEPQKTWNDVLRSR